MAISLTSVTLVDRATIRLQFSEPFRQDEALFTRNNYSFEVRFGMNVPIFAKSVAVYNSTTVDVALQDAMLTEGHYRVTVRGVAALSDGILIELGAGPNSGNFEGVGDPAKVFALKQLFPPWFAVRYGSVLYSFLYSTGQLLESFVGESLTSALRTAYAAMSLRTATGADLSVIGQNYGVDRPLFTVGDDELYRLLIPIFATKRKAALKIFYEALTAALGPQSTSGWAIYEIRANELILEIPADLAFGLAPGSLASATYLHADATVVAPPSYFGDYFLADDSVLGSTIDDHIIVTFQQTAIDDIVLPLKAAGIELVVDVLE